MEFDKQITTLLSKEIKNKKKLEKISNIVFNIVRVGYDYQEQIEELLFNEKITLSKSIEKKLNDLVEDIYWNLPSWILNGYSESELLEDEYDIEDFDNLNKEEKSKAYITTYMMINGVMETKIMLEILEVEHNIKITLAELKKIIEEIDFIAIKGKYIKIDGLETDVIEEIIKYKNILGKYKVIDNVEEILTEFDKIDAEIDKISTKYNLSEDTILSIKSIMNLGGIDSKILEIILEAEGCNISPKKQRELLKDLKRILKDLRLWALNGYKKNELTEVNKIEKIGRNTLCPCGSGKKYKHCCGK